MRKYIKSWYLNMKIYLKPINIKNLVQTDISSYIHCTNYLYIMLLYPMYYSVNFVQPTNECIVYSSQIYCGCVTRVTRL